MTQRYRFAIATQRCGISAMAQRQRESMETQGFFSKVVAKVNLIIKPFFKKGEQGASSRD